MSNEDTQVQEARENEERVIFEQAFKAIDAAEDLNIAIDVVSKLINDLEAIYDGGSFSVGNTRMPRYMLFKTILGVKSIVEQWIKCSNGDKDKSAPAILAQVWMVLESFAKDKTIPPNIYDIVAENHELKEQVKMLRKEK